MIRVEFYQSLESACGSLTAAAAKLGISCTSFRNQSRGKVQPSKSTQRKMLEVWQKYSKQDFPTIHGLIRLPFPFLEEQK
jgi:hypothetical protein